MLPPQPLRMVMASEVNVTVTKVMPAIRALTGWEVTMSFMPYATLGQGIIDSVTTLGKGYYDAYGGDSTYTVRLPDPRRGPESDGTPPLARRAAALAVHGREAALCGGRAHQREVCRWGHQSERENGPPAPAHLRAVQVDLMRAGMLEVQDSYVLADSKIEWADILRCVQRCDFRPHTEEGSNWAVCT